MQSEKQIVFEEWSPASVDAPDEIGKNNFVPDKVRDKFSKISFLSFVVVVVVVVVVVAMPS